MNIERLVVGQLQTNCYLVSCPKTGETVIIDPGDAGDFISRKILDLELKPKLILATHGHFDHILAVLELKLAFNIPFLMHKDDLFLLKRTKRTAEYFLGYPADPFGVAQGRPEGTRMGDPAPKADRYFKEGDIVTFGRENLKVIETPGHTPGGVCFYTKHLRGVPFDSAQDHLGGGGDGGVLFSGDTLFCQGVGRTDFSYCSHENLMRSLQRLFKLPDKTIVYPGHGPETNLAAEKSLHSKFA